MLLPSLTLALATLISTPAAVAKRPTRALRADTVGLRSSSGIASYDEALGIPKCSSEGSSCDTRDLVNGRISEPNYPNTLEGTNCTDGRSGEPSGESVDRIIVSVSSESGGYNIMTAEQSALITATVNCWADGSNDYVYFYYTSDKANNADWTFINRTRCAEGGQQNLTTSYMLPQGTNHCAC